MRKVTIGNWPGGGSFPGHGHERLRRLDRGDMDVSSTGSGAGGSKAAPAPFSGAWTIKATNNINPSYRAAVPFSWSWSWEGVTVRQKGIPTCDIQAINDAKSTSVCPPKSHVGISATPAIAEFGPLGMAEGPNTQCLGKTFDIYNSTGGCWPWC